MMRICYFGIYDPEYARNQVLIGGLKENGVAVIECRVDPRKYPGLSKYWNLWRAGLKIRKRETFDYIIVGFPGQSVYWIAYLLWGKRAVLDMFVSLYDTNVLDRKLYGRLNIRCFRDWFYDWYSIHLASYILLDTREHIKYISDIFSIPEQKFVCVPVSANIAIFHPQLTPPHKNFIVGFTGMLAPIHGVEYIIKAAEILRNHADIKFVIVGSGQDEKRLTKMLLGLNLGNKVTLLPSVPQEELPKIISGFDVCLGIFSDSKKAARVILNKFYHYIAMQRPVITSHSNAMQEQFTVEEDYIGIRCADSEDLAQKILLLYTQPERAREVAKSAHYKFLQELTPAKVTKKLLANLPESL